MSTPAEQPVATYDGPTSGPEFVQRHEPSEQTAIQVENPLGLDDHPPYESQVWLLSPVPMALLCFVIAAVVARFGRRYHELLGAAVGLSSGIAIIAILQDESEMLVDNLSNLRGWLFAVTLLGAAGGAAARAGMVPAGSDSSGDFARHWRRLAWVISLGGALSILSGAVLTYALDGKSLDSWVTWCGLASYAAALFATGWMVGRLAPRFAVGSAVAAVIAPPAILAAVMSRGIGWEFEFALVAMAVLSVPAAVAAHISSSRSPEARAQREIDAGSYGADLVRLAALVLIGGAFLSNFV